MTEYEAILQDCIDALRDGRADVAACLAKYPAHAEALRPALETAAALMQAYSAKPRDEWAQQARERFLVATGERLREAYDIEPAPTFFAAARVKFLMAAQRMRPQGSRAQGEAAFTPQRGFAFGMAFRALAVTGIVAVAFMGFSTYTVASAQDTLPGDWRYPVKRQTERVRLALAFSDGAERGVRLDIAAERTEEIERLAEDDRVIPPSVISDLQEQTEVLADDLDSGELDPGDIERVQAITERTASVLPSAKVAPDAEAARDEVIEAASDLFVAAGVASAQDPDAPIVLTPTDPLETPEPTETPEPSPTDTPPSTEEPLPSVTPEVPATEVPPTPERGGLTIDETPVITDEGVTWVRLVVGGMTTLIPSEKDGWRVAGVNPAQGTQPTPVLVRLVNLDGTQFITINPRNGDLWWYVNVNGVFDEVQVRSERDGQVYVIDRELVLRLYGPLATVPLYVLDHIEFVPEPTPTAEAPVEPPLE